MKKEKQRTGEYERLEDNARSFIGRAAMIGVPIELAYDFLGNGILDQVTRNSPKLADAYRVISVDGFEDGAPGAVVIVQYYKIKKQ